MSKIRLICIFAIGIVLGTTTTTIANDDSVDVWTDAYANEQDDWDAETKEDGPVKVYAPINGDCQWWYSLATDVVVNVPSGTSGYAGGGAQASVDGPIVDWFCWASAITSSGPDNDEDDRSRMGTADLQTSDYLELWCGAGSQAEWYSGPGKVEAKAWSSAVGEIIVAP